MPGPTATDARLDDAHSAAVRGALEEVERLCSEIDALMQPCHHALPRYRDDLTSQQRAVLRDALPALRRQLAEAMQTLGIAPSPEPPSAAQLARSALLLARLTLCEIDAQHLADYGAIAAPLRQQVVAVVERLDAQLRHVRAAFERA